VDHLTAFPLDRVLLERSGRFGSLALATRPRCSARSISRRGYRNFGAGSGRAVDFYVDNLGAKQLRLYLHPTTKAISHVDLTIDGATFSITEEARAWNSDAPPSLGGSPVILQLYNPRGRRGVRANVPRWRDDRLPAAGVRR
jgi:hypothetical protein